MEKGLDHTSCSSFQPVSKCSSFGQRGKRLRVLEVVVLVKQFTRQSGDLVPVIPFLKDFPLKCLFPNMPLWAKHMPVICNQIKDFLTCTNVRVSVCWHEKGEE